MGFGFRLGFLGLFHMEIVQERLEREYDLDIIFTAPSVEYRVNMTDGSVMTIDSPAALPEPTKITSVEEPWCELRIFSPSEHIGTIMDLVTKRRGELKNQTWLDTKRVEIACMIPLSEIIVDFYNELKARTRGYASMDYTLDEYRAADMVKLDILVNQQPVDALSIIVHRDDAYHKGQRLVSKMKEIIPRQMFTVPIQAAIGNKIISRANVQAMRKDVLAKCYGGDITRKRKLLEKQKAGKKRMKMVGQVEIPQEAFMSVLRLRRSSLPAVSRMSRVSERLRRYGSAAQAVVGAELSDRRALFGRHRGAAELTPDDTVLEIGPGVGVLTDELAARGAPSPSNWTTGWSSSCAPTSSTGPMSVLHGDILELDPAAAAGAPTYKVAANLPYYITSGAAPHPRSKPSAKPGCAHGAKEVAERICAGPGDMSLLALSVQFYASPADRARRARSRLLPAAQGGQRCAAPGCTPSPWCAMCGPISILRWRAPVSGSDASSWATA